MNVLSLFDGMSCGQLALYRSNIKVDNYFASEIDKSSIRVTQHNFPNTTQLGDINNWKSWNLPKIDLILAGSPCQGFSINGKKLNFDDPRSKLFFTFVDILHHYSPKYFLLENVVMYKKQWEYIISKCVGVPPVMIDSKHFSAQSRKRLYWTNIPLLPYQHKNLLIKDIVDDADELLTIVEIKNYFDILSAIGINHRTKHSKERILGNIRGKDQKLNCLTASACSGNIAGNGGTTVLIGKNKLTNELYYRVNTRKESELAQTVPVGYTDIVSTHQAKKMLGNGWTVDVIAHILSGINNDL